MLKHAFEDNALVQSQTCDWFKCFKDDQKLFDVDLVQDGLLPITPENVAAVQGAIIEDYAQVDHPHLQDFGSIIWHIPEDSIRRTQHGSQSGRVCTLTVMSRNTIIWTSAGNASK